jgi:hypothetical protein
MRNPQRPPKLTISQILEWADAFHSRMGHWPNVISGPIPEALGESWCSVELAMKAGRRGLPRTGRPSLLLAEHRGWRRPMRRPPLAVHQVLAWAKAFHTRTGRWPRREDGPILEAPGETWMAVQRALQGARRGLPRYASLARLLRTKLAKTGFAGRDLPNTRVSAGKPDKRRNPNVVDTSERMRQKVHRKRRRSRRAVGNTA